MTKILIAAAALATVAGAASASLYGGYPVDVDPATLTETQRLLIDNIVSSADSAGDAVRQIQSIVMAG